jgi:hypothetical protein
MKFCDLLDMQKKQRSQLLLVNDKALIIKTTIILMKFNRNNVGIEDNFQVSSFSAFRLNNRMSMNMCDTTVKIQSILPHECEKWYN